MGILKKLFGDDSQEQSRLIERKFQEMQDKVLAEVANLRAENMALKNEIGQKNNRITELLGKVRDQNEADLLLECKKIEKQVLEGEKRQDIDLSNMNALQNLSAAYQQQMASYRGQAGLGALGGVFGHGY